MGIAKHLGGSLKFRDSCRALIFLVKSGIAIVDIAGAREVFEGASIAADLNFSLQHPTLLLGEQGKCEVTRALLRQGKNEKSM